MSPKPRAVIFDVYNTLLWVRPGPVGAAAELRWAALVRDAFGTEPALAWGPFFQALEAKIRADHAVARSGGIAFPEVDWEGVVTSVLPALRGLSPGERSAFLLAQAGLWHEVGLMDGVAGMLTALRQEGVLLGIASNAQPYSIEELRRALAGAGLGMDLFADDLSFWSFAHGFSKPDPHVHRILTARLGLRGVAPGEALMVGDRLDNDIEPARRQGWQTWQLAGDPVAPPGGDWERLREWWDALG